jgi:tetratricopeptide (TPR) repeat protein
LTTSERFEGLGRQLGRLEHANLIRLATAQPELEYIFRHTLIQESAYQSLVRADRRRVHQAAGQTLEALYSGRDQPPEVSLQLARHFEEATEDARAVHYYTLAGDAARERYANPEAVAAYTRALACAERSLTDGMTWQHLFMCRGRALELNSQYDDALANYQAMARRAEALGDRHLALTAAVASGQLYATATPLFDPPLAERVAEAALAEARTLGDEAAEAKILWNRLNLYRFTQRNPQARECGERSLEIARRLDLKEQAALVLNDLIHVYADLGLWLEAGTASEAAAGAWRELGNTAMMADCLSTTALYSSLRGDFTKALSLAQEAQRLSVAIGNLWGQSYSFSGMVWPYWYAGQPDRAIETTEACIRVGRLAGYLVSEVFDRARLAYMLGELGDTERALELTRQAAAATRHTGGVGLGTTLAVRIHLELRSAGVEQAATTLREMELRMLAPAIWEVDSVLRSRSEVALAQDDALHALETTRAHVARLHELGLLVYLPEARTGLARALLRLGRAPEARECLLKASDQAQAMGAPMIAWTVLRALGQLEAEDGNSAAAETHWVKAREIIMSIAARAPTPELRQSFLARSEVREMFGATAMPAGESQQPPPAQPAL